LPYRQQSNDARHRFHDAVLAATAQIHGHSLLTNRVTIFGTWTHVKVESPGTSPVGLREVWRGAHSPRGRGPGDPSDRYRGETPE
jgi:hypothetical protein